MKIIFTICGNNYLAQAKTMVDSAQKHNPDYHFVIGLVDGFNDEVNYDDFAPAEIIDVSTIDIPEFEDMQRRYDVVEFSTSIKPFYFLHFFRTSNPADLVIYIDPDIMIFDSFKRIEAEIENSTILLTPHSLAPIPQDGKWPLDNLFLNVGVYNLGFIAARNDPESLRFMEWWASCTESMGYWDFAKGLFVDQLWVNFAPLYFTGVKVSHDPGLNMAFWNFHERQLSCKNGKYVVNDSSPLTFFHFSAYSPAKPSFIARQENDMPNFRYSFEARPDLQAIYDDYCQHMLNNGFEFYSQLQWGSSNSDNPFAPRTKSQEAPYKPPRIIDRVRNRLKRLVKRIIGW